MAKVVATQGEMVCQCVVIRQVRAHKEAHRVRTIHDKEPIHVSIIELFVDALPGMRGISLNTRGLMVGCYSASKGARRHTITVGGTKAPCPFITSKVTIKRPVLLN